MKNLILQSGFNARHKMLVGILTILIVLGFSGTSSALWVSGHPYYVDPITSAQVPLDYGYTLKFFWIDPVDKSVNVIAGDGSGNSITYNLDGSYDVEFPDEWEDRYVGIGTYPSPYSDAFYESYHPCQLDFNNAGSYNLGAISEIASFNPGAVGKEIIERPGSSIETTGAPKSFSLSQNYPNPFNPVTKIAFSIPRAGNVTLKVFNIAGKEVASLINEYKSEGNYEAVFNGSELSSGIYFYSLTANGVTITKRLMLMK